MDSFFNPSKFTDAELDEKLSLLTARVNAAYQRNNMQLVAQIDYMIELIRTERDERAMQSDTGQKNPVVYDSDPTSIVKTEKPEVKTKKKSLGNGPVIIKSKPKN